MDFGPKESKQEELPFIGLLLLLRVRLEVAQSYERLMDDATMIQVRSFSDRQAAAEWLEVPETILEPAAVSGR
ncbi:MAG: hypothetical protein WA366_03045 [Pseudolabrys sp.]